MSQSEKLMKIAEGVVNFCTEMRGYLENTKESFDTVLNRHYQANHTPYAVMSFEDEAHYWEETLAEAINRVEYPDYDALEPKGVAMLQRRSYVIIRGNLKSGKTIRYDETKFNQLYINGERYTGDYTFNGETPEIYERLVIIAVQTPFNLGQRVYGDLDILLADFPIENAEIYVNVGKHSELQPNIEELLMTDTAESLYVNGSWTWMCRDYSFIKTLSVTESFSFHSDSQKALPAVENYLVPNSKTVQALSSVVIHNVDMRNAGGIYGDAFWGTKIKGHLDIPNTGGIGFNTFYNCTRLTSVNIGSGITTVSEGAFKLCTNLSTVIIGDNVTSVGKEAFYGCRITKLHLGKSIKFEYNKIVFESNSLPLEEITVSKGYHSPYTHFNKITIPINICLEIFKGILENCANVGEDGRTATTMTFFVTSTVRTAITNAYNEGDETALAIYELMDSKSISITT